MSILKENFEKLKNFLKKREVVLFLLIFLIGSLSFGLGYLAAKQNTRAPIVIEKN